MNLLKKIFQRSGHIMLYGAIMAVMVFGLKWLQWQYLIADYSLEIYLGLVAILFTALGVWVATQLTKPRVKTVVIEKEVYVDPPNELMINQVELEKLNLTNREYDVLQRLAKGYTNADIAAELFVSLSTIKTHVSNLLIKMDVKNRTQAVEKAKRLKLTP